MKTIKLRRTLQSEDLIKVLKAKFSNKLSYSAKENQGKFNIVIKKTPFIGTKISSHNDEIQVEGIFTSGFVSIFVSVFSVTYLNVYEFFRRPMFKMEDEIFHAINDNLNN